MKRPEKTLSNMPEIKILRWSYIKKVLNGFLLPLKKPSPTASPSGKYYRNIDETPLWVFINVLCTDILRYLVYEGKVADNVLQSAWDEIIEQYLDNTFSDEDRHLIHLIFSANLLEFNITKAKAIQRYLTYRYDEEMIQMLLKMGACDGPYPYNGTDDAKEKWNRRITAKVKKWQHTLTGIVQEIKDLQPSDTDNVGKITRKYFDDMLSKLSQHFHYHVDENQITVSRYLSMLNDYKQYLLTLRREANKTI